MNTPDFEMIDPQKVLPGLMILTAWLIARAIISSRDVARLQAEVCMLERWNASQDRASAVEANKPRPRGAEAMPGEQTGHGREDVRVE